MAEELFEPSKLIKEIIEITSPSQGTKGNNYSKAADRRLHRMAKQANVIGLEYLRSSTLCASLSLNVPSVLLPDILTLRYSIDSEEFTGKIFVSFAFIYSC